jgi:hypothetical protein
MDAKLSVAMWISGGLSVCCIASLSATSIAASSALLMVLTQAGCWSSLSWKQLTAMAASCLFSLRLSGMYTPAPMPGDTSCLLARTLPSVYIKSRQLKRSGAAGVTASAMARVAARTALDSAPRARGSWLIKEARSLDLGRCFVSCGLFLKPGVGTNLVQSVRGCMVVGDGGEVHHAAPSSFNRSSLAWLGLLPVFDADGSRLVCIASLKACRHVSPSADSFQYGRYFANPAVLPTAIS